MTGLAGKRFVRACRAACLSFFLGMFVLSPACTCFAWLCARIGRAFGVEPVRQTVVERLFENISSGRFLAIAAVFTLVPLAEEIMFRWIPLFCVTGFTETLPEKKSRAIHVALDVVTSALFAFAHGVPTLVPPMFFLGLAFMRILRRGGLHCSVAAHAGCNFATVVAAAVLSLRA